MPTVSPRLDLAEYIFFGVSVFVLCICVFRIVQTGAWRIWKLAAGVPDLNLQAIDLIIAAYVFFIMPGMIAGLVVTSSPATTQPASTQVSVDQTATTQPEGASGELRSFNSMLALIIGQMICLGVLLIIGWSRFGRRLAAWGLRFDRVGRDLLTAVIVYVASWPICAGVLRLTELLLSFVPGYVFQEHKTIETLLSGRADFGLAALVIFGATILSPLNEELFFRGLLLPALGKGTRSIHSAVIIGGLAFGLIHYSALHTVPPLMIFGIVLGYTYTITRSLTTVFFVHAIFNAKTVLMIVLNRFV